MKNTNQLQERIAGISNLPTLPQVVSRLMEIINDPATSTSDVAEVVGQDVSLSAKILRLANSAFYGIPHTVTNLNNAIVVLGLRVINTLVLSLTVFDMFPHDRRRPALDRAAFWKHSLCCGVLSRLLTKEMRKFIFFDTEEAFCAGLLHDIGKVVMEQYLHDDFTLALKFAREKKQSCIETEEHLLGYSHVDVAEWLTESWGLPDELRAPLLYHHQPANAGHHVDLSTVCHLADVLSYQNGYGIDAGIPAPLLAEETVKQLGLSDQVIAGIVEKLPEEIGKMDIFLSVAGAT